MDSAWTATDAAALQEALAPLASAHGALGYCELAGFLFAVACSPEGVDPAQWLPAALGDEPSGADDAVQRLYGHIREGVLARNPALPAGIAAHTEPMRNFGDEAPLARWSQGYAEGQDWLEEVWDGLLPAGEEDGESPDEVLGSLMMTLSFFADREVAGEFHADTRSRDSFEDFTRDMLEWHPNAMTDLAILARNIADAALAAAQGPARSTKVGRNDPCPCGSGKKFKFCCGAA